MTEVRTISDSTISGNMGVDDGDPLLFGGSGNDVLLGEEGRDIISGGEVDSFEFTESGAEETQFEGALPQAYLLTSKDGDQNGLLIDDGNDLLIVNNGDGSDFLEGQGGSDVIIGSVSLEPAPDGSTETETLVADTEDAAGPHVRVFNEIGYFDPIFG